MQQIYCIKICYHSRYKTYHEDHSTEAWMFIMLSFHFTQVVYKKPPDQIKFTQAVDSPVLVQARINTKQLSDVSSLQVKEWVPVWFYTPGSFLW